MQAWVLWWCYFSICANLLERTPERAYLLALKKPLSSVLVGLMTWLEPRAIWHPSIVETVICDLKEYISNLDDTKIFLNLK